MTRTSTLPSVIDARGGELLWDEGGSMVSRRDESGAVDSSFVPPVFSQIDRVLPISNGVIVSEREDFGDYESYIYITRLDDTGAVVNPRRLVFGGEGAQMSWVYELTGGDLLMYASSFSIDSGLADTLWRSHGTSDTALYYWSEAAGPPIASADGTLHMFGFEPKTDDVWVPMLFSLAPNGAVRNATLYGATWDWDQACWWSHQAGMMRGDAIAFVSGNSCDATHKLLGAVRR